MKFVPFLLLAAAGLFLGETAAAQESDAQPTLSVALYRSADPEPPAAVRFVRTEPGGDAQVFASMTIPSGTLASEKDGRVVLQTAGYRLTASPSGDSPFLLLDVQPVSDGAQTRLDKITLPPIRFETAAPETLRAFGSGGLSPLDARRGSYAFLGLVNPETNAGLLAGWLTGRKGSGVFFAEGGTERASIAGQIDYGALPLPAESDAGETMILGIFDDLRDGLEAYGDALARRNGVRLKPAPSGYCTWYCNKNGGCGTEESTAEFAKAAAEKLVPYGMDFFQIDDGWQLGAGTNGPRKNFTAHDPKGPYHSGLKKTADRLASLGLTTGIWFMPFSGNFDDPWYADKQDLFVRSAIDYPLPGETNTRRFPSIDQKKDAPYESFWGGTSLDMSNPKTREYVADEVSRIVKEWNCRYFKIDGLWTGAAIEQLYVNDEYLPDDIGSQRFFDPALTNIEVYRLGLETVRKAAGDDVFILGCNVSQNMRVMSASIGYVDAMRIGPDNGASWEGICRGPWRATNRYFYNGRVWWNDPDPVYVRDEIPLSHAQTITSWAAISGQLYAFSDWLPDLSDERINVLRRTMPNHQRKTARPVDLFTSDLARVWVLTDTAAENRLPRRDVIGIFNWNGTDAESFRLSAETLGIPEAKEYVLYDFWGDRFLSGGGSAGAIDISVPPASCLIAAARPVTDDRAILLSTSRHVTQGIIEIEKETWDQKTETLAIEIDPLKGALAEELPYQLRLWRPGPAQNVAVVLSNGENARAEAEEAGRGTLYRVTLPRLSRADAEKGLFRVEAVFR